MAALPEPIRDLAGSLNQLPGIGPRTAERLALFIVQSPQPLVQRLVSHLQSARERIQSCDLCGGLTESQPCALCDSAERDGSFLCLVETPVDIVSLEKAGTFRGKYHVLGGKISPINGVGPEDLRVRQLEDRVAHGAVREVVIALPTDVEGEATSHYLAKRLKERGVKASRIAHGLPVGSGLEYADELTLNRALEGRRDL